MIQESDEEPNIAKISQNERNNEESNIPTSSQIVENSEEPNMPSNNEENKKEKCEIRGKEFTRLKTHMKRSHKIINKFL